MSHHKPPSGHWPWEFASTDKDEVQRFTCFSKVEAYKFADYIMTFLQVYPGLLVSLLLQVKK